MSSQDDIQRSILPILDRGAGVVRYDTKDPDTKFPPMTKTVILSCGLMFVGTGCLHPKIGPQSLPRDRSLYSLSFTDSWKEVTLLNIVKVRYIDPPVYVDIGSIVSSYSLLQFSYDVTDYVRYAGNYKNVTVAWQYSWMGRPK